MVEDEPDAVGVVEEELELQHATRLVVLERVAGVSPDELAGTGACRPELPSCCLSRASRWS